MTVGTYNFRTDKSGSFASSSVVDGFGQRLETLNGITTIDFINNQESVLGVTFEEFRHVAPWVLNLTRYTDGVFIIFNEKNNRGFQINGVRNSFPKFTL